MKFYREGYWNKIRFNNLDAIYHDYYNIIFYKNGIISNSKNAALIEINEYKEFILNDEYYGCENDFTKESWRRFTKLKAFL